MELDANHQFVLELLKICIPALLAGLAAYWARKSNTKVDALHVEVNHKMDALMNSEKEKSRLEGVLGIDVPNTSTPPNTRDTK